YFYAREQTYLAQSLGLGLHIVSRGRIALRRRDDRGGRDVQRAWHLEHRDRALDKLALPPVGHQTALEPDRGHPRDAPPLDLARATRAGRGTRGRGAHLACVECVPLFARLSLAARVQLGDA